MRSLNAVLEMMVVVAATIFFLSLVLGLVR